MVGKNIRFLRKQRGMSQDKLAELLGKKNPSTIQHYESGRSTPTVELALEICKIFDVELEDLVNTDLSLSTVYYDKTELKKILTYHDKLTALSKENRKIVYNMIDALSKKGE